MIYGGLGLQKLCINWSVLNILYFDLEIHAVALTIHLKVILISCIILEGKNDHGALNPAVLWAANPT